MASLVLNGNTSGSVTISSPAVSGTTTLTLPSTSGTVITTGSTGQVINKAALPTGSVLQVVNATYSTQTSTTSTSPTDTGLTATITPTSATSKVLVFVSQTGLQKNAANIRLQLQLLRGATVIDIFDVETLYTASTGGSAQSSSTCYLDAPATTSATIYKTQALLSSGAGTATWCVSSSVATITLMEVAA